MKLSDFTYDLPSELIAQYPLSKRDNARLLVVDRANQSIAHDVFSHLNDHLPAKSCLVVNNSKVIPARLIGRRSTGAEVEVFLLKALDHPRRFEAMLRPLRRIKDEEELSFSKGLSCRLIDREKRVVEFNTDDVLEKLYDVGHIPLPPYIKREDEESDRQDYQTVYAREQGSVAAPTAGLHFTDELMADLKAHHHNFYEVTLHTNYGTFKPVEVEDVNDHPMHSEEYEVSDKVWNEIKRARQSNRKVVGVGTTSCRTLESIAAGRPLRGSTDLFIRPGYEFQMMDVLITNFHLPGSTLLMLVYAFGGTKLMRQAYQEAIKERYRFYSYGDAMIIK